MIDYNNNKANHHTKGLTNGEKVVRFSDQLIKDLDSTNLKLFNNLAEVVVVALILIMKVIVYCCSIMCVEKC